MACLRGLEFFPRASIDEPWHMQTVVVAHSRLFLSPRKAKYRCYCPHVTRRRFLKRHSRPLSLLLGSVLLLIYPISTLFQNSDFVSLSTPPSYGEIFQRPPPANRSHEPSLPFHRPQILSFYAQPLFSTPPFPPSISNTSSPHALYIYTSGLSLGSFGRNFRIIGCVVGHDIYSVVRSTDDITLCEIPHLPPKYLNVSVLLHANDDLRLALTYKPVSLKLGLNVTLRKGDIEDVLGARLHLNYAQMKEALRDGVRMVKSDVRWRTFPGEMPPMHFEPPFIGRRAKSLPESQYAHSPRFEICVVTQMKLYVDLLEDWVSYHRRLGVDMVYIFDNDIGEFGEEIPESIGNREDVEVLYWPFKRSQTQCFSYALHSARARCEWVLMMDVDEYVMIDKLKGEERDKPLREVLRKSKERRVEQVRFRYVTMTGNDTKKSDMPLPLRYTMLAEEQAGDLGKSACLTDVDWSVHGVHQCEKAVQGDGRNNSRWHGTSEDRDIERIEATFSQAGRIVHFKYRSWTELKQKKMGGSNSIKDNIGVETEILGERKEEWFGHALGEWTKFRENYRTVMDTWTEDLQRLVWTRGGRRCFADVDKWGQAYEKGCSNRSSK